MGRSPGFGYITTYFIRPFQTRFRCGSGFSTLTLHVIMTRRFILQEARRHPLTGSDSFVGTWFQELFHSPPGVLFTFPHGIGSLSVTREYLALRDGPRGFRRGFTCPAVLRILNGENQVSSTGLSPSLVWLPSHFDYLILW